MIEVTPQEFKEKFRDHMIEKQDVLLVESDPDSSEFYYAALFENGHPIPAKEWEDQTKEELQKIVLQANKAIHYEVVDELDRYLIEYPDDTEFIREFQYICTKIVERHLELDEVKAQLAELVGLYRLSERSGYRLADMVEEAEREEDPLAD
jgi:hypothetical protein